MTANRARRGRLLTKSTCTRSGSRAPGRRRFLRKVGRGSRFWLRGCGGAQVVLHVRASVIVITSSRRGTIRPVLLPGFSSRLELSLLVGPCLGVLPNGRRLWKGLPRALRRSWTASRPALCAPLSLSWAHLPPTWQCTAPLLGRRGLLVCPEEDPQEKVVSYCQKPSRTTRGMRATFPLGSVPPALGHLG